MRPATESHRGTGARPGAEEAPAVVHGGGAGPEVRLDGLRIALVNWRDPWQPDAGGAEEYAWQMSRRLRGLGAEVTFVTCRRDGQARDEERDGVRLARMGGTYTRYPLVLAWLLRRRRAFDAVVDCMNGVPFFTPLAVSRSTKVLLLVHHVHTEQFGVYFRPLMAAVGRAIEGPLARLLYRRRPAVAISPSTAAAMRGRLRWLGPIYVVPNGSPALRPVLGGTADPDQASGDPALVFVGRLVAHKRVDLLVEAAARLRETRPGLRLHIVGRGPEHTRLAALAARHGLGGAVVLHGYLPEARKNALLAGARLHLTASAFEGWGLSVAEAAALGVPTVACDVAGLREAVRDGVTGWLAAPGEDLADELAHTAERALRELDDPARRAEVRAACLRWSGAFSWAASAERLALLIREAPALGRAGGAYVASHTGPDGEPRATIAENTTPEALHTRFGDRLTALRPARPLELLTGRPEPDPESGL